MPREVFRRGGTVRADADEEHGGGDDAQPAQRFEQRLLQKFALRAYHKPVSTLA